MSTVSAQKSRKPSLERLLWTMGVVIGATLPHWLSLPPWVPLLLSLCVAWRFAAALRGWTLPNAPFRAVLALLAFGAVFLEYRTVNGVEAGSALLVVMVSLKLLESQTYRDQLVLMMIAYFLVFAALLDASGLLVVAYLLGFVWLTTVGVLQLARQGSLLGAQPTMRLAGRLLAQALPIMVVLFLLFPRLPQPLWAMPGIEQSGSSGLDDEMSPGDLTELGLSDEPAFRVEFYGRPPRADRLYWRGPVLSLFNGRTWTRDAGMRRRASATLEYEGEPVEYRVMLEPHGRRWAFALDMPRSWDEGRNIFMSSDYQLLVRMSTPVHSRIDYRVTSHVDYRALDPLSDAERSAYTRLPARANPRTRDLVSSWLADQPTPRELIGRALALFQAEQFYYTLTPPPLGSHPTDDFLFTTREGFCEHYASAFTVMMRAAGIPARVVTGYQGGELNPVGEYFIVRQSNAHAWTEVWLEGEGWVRVDPTGAVAPERIALGSSDLALGEAQRRGSALAQFPWMRQALLAWDAVETYWQDWVLGYGPELQRALLETLGIERPSWRKLATLAVVAMALLLVALTLYLGWTYRRRRRPDDAARQFDRFCAKLGKHVARRRPAEGPVAYGRRAARALPAQATAIDGVVGAYVRARYEPDTSRANLGRLKLLVQTFQPAPPPGSAR